MRIRKANKKDFLEIGKIMGDVFSKPPYAEKWTDKSSKRMLNYFFKIGKIFVASVNGKIAGAIIFRYEPWESGYYLVIEQLFVSTNIQNNGIGKKLLKKIEIEAKKRKVSAIYFSTHKESKAFNFYKKLGYKESKHIAIMGKEFK